MYGAIALFSIIRLEFLPEENIPPIVELLPRWPWWIWALVGMGILCIATLEGAYRQIRQVKTTDNWIDVYYGQHGELPPAPGWLVEFVPQLEVDKQIEPKHTKTPSGQLWNRTPTSVRRKLQEYADWAHQKNPELRPFEDIKWDMERMQPRTPPRPKGWRPFEQH